jgi:hypothetical protein
MKEDWKKVNLPHGHLRMNWLFFYVQRYMDQTKSTASKADMESDRQWIAWFVGDGTVKPKSRYSCGFQSGEQ